MLLQVAGIALRTRNLHEKKPGHVNCTPNVGQSKSHLWGVFYGEYDEDFKIEVAKHYLSARAGARSLVAKYGLNHGTVRHWAVTVGPNGDTSHMAQRATRINGCQSRDLAALPRVESKANVFFASLRMNGHIAHD